MGAMLAPPLLDGTIPAFYSTDQGIELTIPFSMNRVVSLNQQVKAFQVKIKTMQSSTQLESFEVAKQENQGNEVKYIFENENHKFKVGQFYKIQLAYVDNDGVVGCFSSVAVAKYTQKPTLTIENLDNKELNSHQYTYTGKYQNSDSTERVYSYAFNIYDTDDKLIATSGSLLHNTINDDPLLSYTTDSYTFPQDFPIGAVYRLEYIVTTINNLTIATPRKYRITQKVSISPDLNAQVITKLNYDNGYVSVDLRANDVNELTTGSFIIHRASEDSNYMQWDKIYEFSLIAQVPNLHLFNDFTVEQGKKYIYAIQQYNSNGLYSNRLTSNEIYVDFEDAFLFDGERQLKIKYNPKVSSFKKNLLEQKTDTIGGKYPFIFRNGRVYYSEFSISGLISYQMDEENLFLQKVDYNLTENTTNLTGENIASERQFKMKVLEWLTNGEPKVFRSPAEGNYIVRLMNSSLSPNDTVGRMLHTFTSTAYEIADYNYDVLKNMGFIKPEEQNSERLQWKTIEFTGEAISLTDLKARTVRFDNMYPGAIVKIRLENTTIFQEIKIGATGSYYVDLGIAIKDIEIAAESATRQGSMTYSYKYAMEPAFNNISNVKIAEVPQHQFIGEHDILQELLYIQKEKKDGSGEYEWVRNPKVELTEMYRIGIEERPLQRIPVDRGGSVSNYNRLNDPYLTYEIGYYDGNDYSPIRPRDEFKLREYYDGYNKIHYQNEKAIYEPHIILNNNIISVNETEEAEYIRPGQITSLKSGNGALVNLSYQMAIIDYTVEDIAWNNRHVETHYLHKLGQALADYKIAQSVLKNRREGGKATYATTENGIGYWNVDTYNKVIHLANGYDIMYLTFSTESQPTNTNKVYIKQSSNSNRQAQLYYKTESGSEEVLTSAILNNMLANTGRSYWAKRTKQVSGESVQVTWTLLPSIDGNGSQWRESFPLAINNLNNTYQTYISELIDGLEEKAKREGRVE